MLKRRSNDEFIKSHTRLFSVLIYSVWRNKHKLFKYKYQFGKQSPGIVIFTFEKIRVTALQHFVISRSEFCV